MASGRPEITVPELQIDTNDQTRDLAEEHRIPICGYPHGCFSTGADTQRQLALTERDSGKAGSNRLL